MKHRTPFQKGERRPATMKVDSAGPFCAPRGVRRLKGPKKKDVTSSGGKKTSHPLGEEQKNSSFGD